MIRAFLPAIMQILLLVVLGNTLDSTMKLLIVIVQFLLVCYQLSIKEVE